METLPHRSADALGLMDWDHLHFYVGNARQAAHFYVTAFGFRLTAYAGPETGVRESASYLLEQGEMRMVLTSPLGPDGPIADFVRAHGDGIADVALRVPDARAALEAARAGRATIVAEAAQRSDDHGRVVTASIRTYGDTIHTFIERGDYRGPFMPVSSLRLRRCERRRRSGSSGSITSWATSAGTRSTVGPNTTPASSIHPARLVRRPRHFHRIHRVALDRDVKCRPQGQLPDQRAGQRAQEIANRGYLDFFGAAAPARRDCDRRHRQHRARTARKRRRPAQSAATYYDALRSRVGDIGEDIDVLRELSILVDRDDLGYMLQIFTRTMQDRPTLFFELIQRKGKPLLWKRQLQGTVRLDRGRTGKKRSPLVRRLLPSFVLVATLGLAATAVAWPRRRPGPVRRPLPRPAPPARKARSKGRRPTTGSSRMRSSSPVCSRCIAKTGTSFSNSAPTNSTPTTWNTSFPPTAWAVSASSRVRCLLRARGWCVFTTSTTKRSR